MAECTGPVFDGKAEAALDRFAKAAQDAIGQKGVDEIRARLASVLKVDRGVYESHIHTERQIDDLVVTDTPIVYGPWLEGTGSRDAPDTRFPGYHTFRLVGQKLDGEAKDIAEAKLHDGGYLREMN